MQSYLQSGRFVDSDHPVVVEFAEKSRGNSANPRDQAVAPYDAVRYDPYVFSRDPRTLVASHALQQGCVPKAILLAACARHCRIPARIGLADVRNHLATPAFSRALCRAFDVAPLEFDGVAESVSMRSIARAKATGSTWPTTCRPGPGKMKAIDSHHQPARLPSSVHHR